MFGHSHLNVIFLKNIKLKKSGKYKFNLKHANTHLLTKLSAMICEVKPNNMYTNRGIRISRCLIQRRKGKKSSYI